MNFYEKYEMLCKSNGISPNSPQARNISGVSSGTISGWSAGKNPSVDALKNIANFFHVSTDYLLDMEEPQKKNTHGFS